MKYIGSPGFNHQQSERIGVLIANLGTPDAPTTPALRRYLKEFLSDPRVVEAPRLIWWFALHGVILNIRPPRSAKSYATVFTEQGSPLMFHTVAQCEALTKELTQRGQGNLVVEFAMRYGNPSISSVLQKMMDQGVRRLVVLPLYPQYSGSTTASIFDAIAADFIKRRWIPELRFINHYHDFAPFIKASAARIREHWEQYGRADKLLFSYHGIPLRYLHNGDPYHCECYKTSRLIAAELGLQEGEYLTTFQSRFGREEWLKPYTDATLKGLPGQGAKFVQVFCPGFSTDCLETIEEIGEENKEYFLHAGGERYEYITALNSRADHISALADLVQQHLLGWEESGDDPLRLARAREVGADK